MAQFRTIVINVLRDQPSLLLCLFRQTSANVRKLFAFVDGVFNELSLLRPSIAVQSLVRPPFGRAGGERSRRSDPRSGELRTPKGHLFYNV